MIFPSILLFLPLQSLSLVLNTHPVAQPKLYYVRDVGGLSNVRLQFQLMVALAAAKNRHLVIPPASQIAHLSEPFIDTDLWEPEKLVNVINFTVVPTAQNLARCPPNSFQPIVNLCETDISTFPADKDWCLGEESRIHHFECVRGLTDSERKFASAAVFNGLQLRRSLIQDGQTALQKLNLTSGSYVAVHLRRGDFAGAGAYPWIRDKAGNTGENIAARIKASFNGNFTDIPIVLASDAKTDDPVYTKLVSEFKSHRLVKTSALTHHPSTFKDAALDMFLCMQAGTFFGSPSSTFSKLISEFRQKITMCQGSEVPGNHRWWTAQVLETFDAENPNFAHCWNRVTTFESMDALAKKDCSTFRLL